MPTKTEQSDTPDVLFYHLERARIGDVLPSLLVRSLQRGWRAVVETASRKQADELNQMLWTFSDESFLPHGAADDGFAEDQPIYLTEKQDNPNGAQIRFFVGGATPGEFAGYERMVYVFDGRSDEAVAAARAQWKRLTGEGLDVTYWRQNEQGAWEKKA